MNHSLFSLLQSVQSLICVQLSATPWTATCQASLSITNTQSLLKLMSIESVMPSNHLILCHPLLLLLSILPNIRLFSNESVLRIRWPNYWSFRFNISPSNEYSGLISFRKWGRKELDMTERLHSPTHSAFFMVQLSHLYMSTGKTIALIIQTFVRKVMSLFFNMLSRFVNYYHPIYGLLR